MNEQLQQALRRVLDGLDATATFLSAEIPDVVHQLLLWYAVKHGIEMLLGIAILVGYVAAVVWGWKEARAFEFEAAIASVAVGLLTLVVAAYLINLEWLQILIAPKIWLIEYAAKLVK